MKIYTKTGDQGETGLLTGRRVRKDHPRVEAYGTVDELNSLLGVAREAIASGAEHDRLVRIQSELFSVGAELAALGSDRPPPERIGPSHIRQLENEIDELDGKLRPLRHFILPGGCRASAMLHLARTVCRRAERRIVSLAAEREPVVPEQLMVYLNRLGDLLFVMARATNAAAGQSESIWNGPSKPSQCNV